MTIPVGAYCQSCRMQVGSIREHDEAYHAEPRWPIGSSWYFTEEFLNYAYGVEKREGEFEFGGATWQHRGTVTDEQGRRSYRCVRVR